MSDESFEVRGPHDDEIEHAGDRGRADPFAGRIAMTTALLATVGALCSYMAGQTQAEASLSKNNAAIKITEASDQWNYYQAKTNKQNLAELGQLLATAERKDRFLADISRYTKERDAIKGEAERLEAESKQWDKTSDAQMHVHHRWAQAMTVLQIAIALSAIALLTRRAWLQYVVYTFASLGAVAVALALLRA